LQTALPPGEAPPSSKEPRLRVLIFVVVMVAAIAGRELIISMGGPVTQHRVSLITAKTPRPSSCDDDDVRIQPGIAADDNVIVDADEAVPSMTTVMDRVSHLHRHYYFVT
jgi:hypothetical protein